MTPLAWIIFYVAGVCVTLAIGFISSLVVRERERKEANKVRAKLTEHRVLLTSNLISIRVTCSDVSPLVPVLVAALESAMLRQEAIDTIELRDQLEFFQVRRDQDVRNAAVDLLRSEKKEAQ